MEPSLIILLLLLVVAGVIVCQVRLKFGLGLGFYKPVAILLMIAFKLISAVSQIVPFLLLKFMF